jgi:hypothetical protein
MASAELRAFLAGIAVDPERLGAFMQDPDAVLAASDLDEEDKVAVRSGNYATLRARLDGPIMDWHLFQATWPPFQAFSQAFSQAFPQAFSQAFSQALSQAFRQIFPPAFPDANADTSDAGPPADHPGDDT